MSSGIDFGGTLKTPSNEIGSRWKSILLVILVAIIGLILLSGLTIVQAYESCLLVRNGSVEEQWSEGLHWHFSPVSDVACYRTARATYEASPGESGSGAEYNDDAVDALTKDGQRIDAVSFRIAFSVPEHMVNAEGDVTDASNLQNIYTNVGASSGEDLVSTVVAFYARPEIRTVMQSFTSEQILEGITSEINSELENRLRPKFAENGVILQSIEISKIDFNDALEEKLQRGRQAVLDAEIAEQDARLQENENQIRIRSAETDAEIGAIEADAEAATMAIKAQSDADSIVVIANAEASAVSMKIEAIGSPELYLQQQQIAAIGGWPVQIFGENGATTLYQIPPIVDLAEDSDEE